MYIQIFKKGFNFSQDGPGNRLVYHLQGCNLICPWCANPEGMGAGGTAVLVQDLADEAVSCRAMFFSGGGVTLTGGEPTMQFAAVCRLLQNLKENGIDTALETNGTHLELERLFPLVDHLMMDCKHYDPGTLQKVVGAKETVFNNLKKAAGGHPDLLIRIPLIGGFNASMKDAAGFAAFFSSLPNAKFRVEVLPYHEYGKSKWEALGIPYRMGQEAFVSAEQAAAFRQCLINAGYTVVHT